MLKLLTRKDLWVSVAFSVVVWLCLPLVGASTRFSQSFGGLFLLLSILTISMADDEQTPVEKSDKDCEADEKSEALHALLRSQRETQRQIQEELTALRQDIKSLKEGAVVAPLETSAAEAPAKLGELSGALSEAMKQITSRDGQIDVLTKNVNQTNIQRNLVRLTQSLEITLSLQKRLIAGQSDPAESIQFIVDDLEAALAANGVEHLVILPGTKIPELKAGSFITVTVVDAPSPELKGTVKEVRTRAYFINEDNRPRFICPAKVVLYKA